jgi:hypothetical protein
MTDFLLEAVEIEIVANVIFIHFAKKVMVFKTAKPLDPAAFGNLGVVYFSENQILKGLSFGYHSF